MRLSDVIGAMGMSVFPIVGLGCFLGVFLAASWRVWRADRTEMERAGRMALDDGAEDRS